MKWHESSIKRQLSPSRRSGPTWSQTIRQFGLAARLVCHSVSLYQTRVSELLTALLQISEIQNMFVEQILLGRM